MAKNQNMKKPKQNKVQVQDTEFSQEIGQGVNNQQQGFNQANNNKQKNKLNNLT